MDIGEYRLVKSTDIYEIKVSKWLCYCPIFTVKGIKADDSDFGDKEDIDCHCEDKPDHGCGNMTFTPKLATQKVLDKYGITVDEYNEIASVLEDGLSFGYCGLCS
jgi:hypothetical protein